MTFIEVNDSTNNALLVNFDKVIWIEKRSEKNCVLHMLGRNDILINCNYDELTKVLADVASETAKKPRRQKFDS